MSSDTSNLTESIDSAYITKKEIEGTFDWSRVAGNSLNLIEDAYNAVISTKGAVEFFKSKSEDDSFMFTPQNHHIWDEIHSKMKEYDCHSGYSYAWTLRNIEYIFKNGWDEWVFMMKKSSNEN